MNGTTVAPSIPVVLTPEEVAALPLVPLDASIDGVSHRVLWTAGSSAAGVMKVEAGHHLGRHTHRLNHHHLWVLDGEVEILGVVVTSGGYVHVPGGVEHDLDARATSGCTVLYLYLSPSA